MRDTYTDLFKRLAALCVADSRAAHDKISGTSQARLMTYTVGAALCGVFSSVFWGAYFLLAGSLMERKSKPARALCFSLGVMSLLTMGYAKGLTPSSDDLALTARAEAERRILLSGEESRVVWRAADLVNGGVKEETATALPLCRSKDNRFAVIILNGEMAARHRAEKGLPWRPHALEHFDYGACRPEGG